MIVPMKTCSHNHKLHLVLMLTVSLMGIRRMLIYMMRNNQPCILVITVRRRMWSRQS